MIGFIGLGNMGYPMANRLADAGRELVVYDTRSEVVERAMEFGAQGTSSPQEVADRAEIVLASLPSPQASAAVTDDVAAGAKVTLFIDLSTVGSEVAHRNHDTLTARGIAALDALGRPFFVDEKPGTAQTMKLVNNLMAATTLAATAEVMVMGVKAGLDPQVMLDVLNAGSGGTHASRDKFPKAVLPRTFDYGFATGLMVKDVRLYLDEAQALGLPRELADTVAGMWESTLREQGPESDFTSIVKVLEKAAGVTVGAIRRSR